MRVFTRELGCPVTIYTKAAPHVRPSIVENGYYRVFRVSDEHEVIAFGTGSAQETKMSYDISGSYFDLDMSLFQEDRAYALQFAYLLNGKYIEQPETFKFRIRR